MESGPYGNASEVVRAGLRKLEDETKANTLPIDPDVDSPELHAFLRERWKSKEGHIHKPGDFRRRAEKRVAEFRATGK